MNEVFKIVIIGIAIIAVPLLATGLMLWADATYGQNVSCPNYANQLNLEYKYNFWAGGCFIKVKDNWINSDQYRIID